MSRYTQGGPDHENPYYHQNPYQSQMHVVSDHTRKTPKLWPWILIAVVVIGCLAGGIYVTAASLTAASKEVTVPTPSILPAPDRSPDDRIEEGVWSVGQDIVPGEYQVTERLLADTTCYWEISRDNAGQDIVSNANPTGGIPRVTLKKGQWFKTQECGVWVQVK